MSNFSLIDTLKKIKPVGFSGLSIYDVTIFDVPQVGDWPLKLIIKKDDNGYAAELQTNSEDPAASEYLWEVTSTSVDDNMVYIDATIAAYNLNFELSIDEDYISGSMMGMFDVEGIRVK